MKNVLSIGLLLTAPCSSFMSSPRTRSAPWTTTTSTTTTSSNNMLPEATNWIATIDADIANISDNEFAPVFMGGIAVMFGGLASATAVGFILEKGDLYANVVADSYIQQGNDEEFWKGLSEDERIKGQAILKQLEAKKNGEIPADAPPVAVMASIGGDESKQADAPPAAPAKEKDMFSDY
mmetsp:Transcript_3966/g.6642  ORF Transcript_3966/g.6642 Transcript_3966/m.6642 type:complete len:180 (-) Transcript_3966:409-948(-)